MHTARKFDESIIPRISATSERAARRPSRPLQSGGGQRGVGAPPGLRVARRAATAARASGGASQRRRARASSHGPLDDGGSRAGRDARLPHLLAPGERRGAAPSRHGRALAEGGEARSTGRTGMPDLTEPWGALGHARHGTNLLTTIAAEDRRRERDEKREERDRRRRLRRTAQHHAAGALPAAAEMHDHRDTAPEARR
jgi:hypothetical protein